MADADAFVQALQPYRGKHTRQATRGEPRSSQENQWFHVERSLTNSVIDSALRGDCTIGYFARSSRDVLGADVDDHETPKPWTNGRPSARLHARYDAASTQLGTPSLVARSPRGLHLYWKLDIQLPDHLLTQLARQKLNGVAEVRPTMRTSLRIPRLDSFLDPESLSPMRNGLKELPVIHPSTLFLDAYLPRSRREMVKEGVQGRIVGTEQALERIEASVRPLRNGTSNEVLGRLAPAYRARGLSVNEAAARVSELIELSPEYVGELRQKPGRLLQRITSYYQRPTPPLRPTANQIDLSNPLIDALVTLSRFSRQRENAIRRFLGELLRWIELQDTIAASVGDLSHADYLYPYYRKNRQEGYYPLPCSLMRKWNDRYNQLVDWLCEISFLEPAPYKYVPEKGICKYYSVHPTRFGVFALSRP